MSGINRKEPTKYPRLDCKNITNKEIVYVCPHCGSTRTFQAKDSHWVGRSEPQFKCPSCKGVITIREEDVGKEFYKSAKEHALWFETSD